MRCAIIATPALLPDVPPSPGALDGDLLRSRLPQPDSGFTVVDLDPAQDLAEQLDAFFDKLDKEPGSASSPALFYVSSQIVLAVDGEPFVCLDPSDLHTGDSLKDLAAVLRDRVKGPLLIIVECRHAPDAKGPPRSAAVIEAVKNALPPGGGVELLIAA